MTELYSTSNSLPSSMLLIESMLLSSIFVLFLSLILGILIFKNVVLAILVAVIKTSVFVLYFTFFFNKSNFNFIDQEMYFFKSIEISNNHINSVSDFFFSPSFTEIFSGHTLFPKINIVSFYIFGHSITSPVGLCVIAHMISGLYFSKILGFSGLCARVKLVILILFLLHPSLVAWSSFFNLRDIFILLCLLAIFYHFYALVVGKPNLILQISSLGFALLCLFYLRVHIFYLLTCVLPVVFILTLKPKFTKSWVRLNIAVIFSFSGFLFLKWDVLTGIAAIYLKDFQPSILNLAKLYLSPLFNIDILYKGYGFTIFNSYLNIISLPFIFVSFFRILVQRSRFEILLLIYFGAIFVTITFYGNIQGPRQRIMVEPFILYMQVTGWLVVYSYFSKLYRLK